MFVCLAGFCFLIVTLETALPSPCRRTIPLNIWRSNMLAALLHRVHTVELHLIQAALHFVGHTTIQFFHKYWLPKNVCYDLSNTDSQKWDNTLWSIIAEGKQLWNGRSALRVRLSSHQLGGAADKGCPCCPFRGPHPGLPALGQEQLETQLSKGWGAGWATLLAGFCVLRGGHSHKMHTRFQFCTSMAVVGSGAGPVVLSPSCLTFQTVWNCCEHSLGRQHVILKQVSPASAGTDLKSLAWDCHLLPLMQKRNWCRVWTWCWVLFPCTEEKRREISGPDVISFIWDESLAQLYVSSLPLVTLTLVFPSTARAHRHPAQPPLHTGLCPLCDGDCCPERQLQRDERFGGIWIPAAGERGGRPDQPAQPGVEVRAERGPGAPMSAAPPCHRMYLCARHPLDMYCRPVDRLHCNMLSLQLCGAACAVPESSRASVLRSADSHRADQGWQAVPLLHCQTR